MVTVVVVGGRGGGGTPHEVVNKEIWNAGDR